MIEIKDKLTLFGHEIILPKNAEKYANGTIDVENKLEKIQLDEIL